MTAITASASTGLLGRRNPAAKLLAAAVIMVGLLVTADLVTASILLGCELVAIPLSGVSLRALAVRAWPLPVAAVGVAIANLVGSDASVQTVVAVSLRLLAISLPGIVVFLSTEAVDLADSLVQQLRVPARFAYGALAAFRLLPALRAEWAIIRRARRARGIDADRTPWGALGLFASEVFALFIGAIRRGVRLAMAMDSRGFDSGAPRTIARRQVVTWRDRLLVVGVAIVMAAASVVALALGTWRPLL